MKELDDIVDERFYSILESDWYAAENNTVRFGQYSIYYDCGQLLQNEDSQYADSASGIELEITDTESGESWSVYAIFDNYIQENALRGVIEDPHQAKLFLEEVEAFENQDDF
jgi:hypothetical protein